MRYRLDVLTIQVMRTRWNEVEGLTINGSIRNDEGGTQRTKFWQASNKSYAPQHLPYTHIISSGQTYHSTHACPTQSRASSSASVPSLASPSTPSLQPHPSSDPSEASSSLPPSSSAWVCGLQSQASSSPSVPSAATTRPLTTGSSSSSRLQGLCGTSLMRM